MNRWTFLTDDDGDSDNYLQDEFIIFLYTEGTLEQIRTKIIKEYFHQCYDFGMGQIYDKENGDYLDLDSEEFTKFIEGNDFPDVESLNDMQKELDKNGFIVIDKVYTLRHFRESDMKMKMYMIEESQHLLDLYKAPVDSEE